MICTVHPSFSYTDGEEKAWCFHEKWGGTYCSYVTKQKKAVHTSQFTSSLEKSAPKCVFGKIVNKIPADINRNVGLVKFKEIIGMPFAIGCTTPFKNKIRATLMTTEKIAAGGISTSIKYSSSISRSRTVIKFEFERMVFLASSRDLRIHL